MNKNKLKDYQEQLQGKNAAEILGWVAENFSTGETALATSLGAEDQVLTDMIVRAKHPIGLFSLDTGRLPDETYATLQKTLDKYGIKIEVLFPEKKSVEDMVNRYGPNLFYQSIDMRKQCCKVRKIEALTKKLEGLSLWITGLRKEQSVTRNSLNAVEWDETFKLFKISPLFSWSEDDVWDYIRENHVPYNSLHNKGYPSIGCAPCTRAVSEGGDLRSGRWWWEKPENRECGLHIADTRIVRRK